MFLEAGDAPRSVMELDNVDSAKKMVGLGLGVHSSSMSKSRTRSKRAG